MAYKTREEILAQTTRRYTEVANTRIRNLDELELSTLKGLWASRYNPNATPDLRGRRELVALVVCDENGERVLSNDDVDALGAVDGAYVEKVYDKAAIHCGINDDPDKEVNAAEKKSD